jgi:hypothetical protein
MEVMGLSFGENSILVFPENESVCFVCLVKNAGPDFTGDDFFNIFTGIKKKIKLLLLVTLN